MTKAPAADPFSYLAYGFAPDSPAHLAPKRLPRPPQTAETAEQAPKRPGRKKEYFFTPDDAAAARQMILNGLSRRDVAAEMGISVGALYQLVPALTPVEKNIVKSARLAQEAAQGPTPQPGKPGESFATLAAGSTTTLLAIPLLAAAASERLRGQFVLPQGWEPDKLWSAFIDHNRNVHAVYRNAPIDHPFNSQMTLRYAVQGLTPDRLANGDRDGFILHRAIEKNHYLVREVFLLVASQPPEAGKPNSLQGELWIDKYKKRNLGTRHTFVMNPAHGQPGPDTSRMHVLVAQPGGTYQKLPAPTPALRDKRFDLG